MITRAKLSSVVQGLPKYRSMLAGNAAYEPPVYAYESISSYSISSATASVTFSSIPSTYKHLEIHVLGKTTQAGLTAIYTTFNSDTSANYSYARLEFAPTASSSQSSGATNMFWPFYPGSTHSSDQFGQGIYHIIDYASTVKRKSVLSYTNMGNPTSSDRAHYVINEWKSTSAISSMTLTMNNFEVGSMISLYGIMG